MSENVYLADRQRALRATMAAVFEQGKALDATCARVGDPKGFHGDVASRTHAVQLVDEAIKTLADTVEVLGRANAALADFATG